VFVQRSGVILLFDEMQCDDDLREDEVPVTNDYDGTDTTHGDGIQSGRGLSHDDAPGETRRSTITLGAQDILALTGEPFEMEPQSSEGNLESGTDDILFTERKEKGAKKIGDSRMPNGIPSPRGAVEGSVVSEATESVADTDAAMAMCSIGCETLVRSGALREQSMPGAYRQFPDISLLHDYTTDDTTDGSFHLDVEVDDSNTVGTAPRVQLEEIEAQPAEEEDERIRQQIRQEIIQEAVAAEMVKDSNNSRLLLLGLGAILAVTALAFGLGVGLTSGTASSTSTSEEAGSTFGLEISQNPAISLSPTSASSTFPTSTPCPCFSEEYLLEFRASLPEGHILDCGAFGSSDVGFNCRRKQIDCGFLSTVFCSGDCGAFTDGILGCTIVQESVQGTEIDTIEITEAEDMACRQNIYAFCPDVQR
jgi:hypothetical protein